MCGTVPNIAAHSSLCIQHFFMPVNLASGKSLSQLVPFVFVYLKIFMV